MKLTLAKVFEGKRNVIGWLMSEKFDGWRAYWDGRNFYSRAGKLIEAPASFKRSLPNFPLDGELFYKRDEFQTLSSILRTEGDSWRGVKFLVFDTPIRGDYRSRFEKAKSAIRRHTANRGKVVAVAQKLIKNMDQVQREFKRIISKKGEGLMLRNPNVEYMHKRTHNLLKMKPKHDLEVPVIGYKVKGGILMSLLVKYKDDEFFVGTGFSDFERDNFKRLFPIGTLVTIAYVSLTLRGIPRHASFIRVRSH
jgi:DNA ligase-1